MPQSNNANNEQKRSFSEEDVRVLDARMAEINDLIKMCIERAKTASPMAKDGFNSQIRVLRMELEEIKVKLGITDLERIDSADIEEMLESLGNQEKEADESQAA